MELEINDWENEELDFNIDKDESVTDYKQDNAKQSYLSLIHISQGIVR